MVSNIHPTQLNFVLFLVHLAIISFLSEPTSPLLLFVGTQPVDESQVVVSFHQWLGSVTERINQTMHYQFDGKGGNW